VDPELGDPLTAFEAAFATEPQICSGRLSQEEKTRAADGIRTRDPELGKPGRGS
jgi:hypothetical protein